MSFKDGTEWGKTEWGPWYKPWYKYNSMSKLKTIEMKSYTIKREKGYTIMIHCLTVLSWDCIQSA